MYVYIYTLLYIYSILLLSHSYHGFYHMDFLLRRLVGGWHLRGAICHGPLYGLQGEVGQGAANPKWWFNGDLMGFNGDSMGFNGDLMGFNGDSMGFNGI